MRKFPETTVTSVKREDFTATDYVEAHIVQHGISYAGKMVLDFQLFVKVFDEQDLKDIRLYSNEVSEALIHAADKIHAVSSNLENFISGADKRGLRGHLCAEEVSELLLALAVGDEVKVLDALSDLLYVAIGTAVTFDLPLGDAFVEVHHSNMSKEKQEDDASKDRLRKKGDNYRPPNLAKIMEFYENKKCKNAQD